MRKVGVASIEKNYHFKEELAYTEDNVLIYKIFVYNIPRKTTQVETLKYFSSFGEIKSVILVPDKRKSRKSAPKVGFIQFIDPISAARALKHSTPPHILKSKRVSVIACNSWQQPVRSPSQSVDNDSNEYSIQQSNSLKLTELNDDCLEHIFKKLVLKDQVRFALTCQRMKNIFEMVCKTEYRKQRMEELAPLTLWEVREYLTISGPHIEALHGIIPYKDRNRIIEFIGKFCYNLKTIDFNATKFKCSSFFRLFGKLRNCTVLELRDCCLKDHAIHALKRLPHLQSLTVADNYELTGKYMDRLTTVTDLVLYGCRNIQPSYFTDIIKSLKDLQSLDIQLCDRLKTFSFSMMLDHAHRLECLKISCSVDSYDCVARLPCLKKLEVLCVTSALRPQLFEELVEHKANKLESLKIVAKNSICIERARQIARLTNLKELVCSNNDNLTDECLQKFGLLKNLEEIELKNCTSITNEGLLQLVRSCTNLKKVNIQLCTGITDQFVPNVIKILKSNPNQRGREPCLFYVARSGIGNYMLNQAEYLAAKGLLKLSFYAPLALVIEREPFLDDEDDDSDDDYAHHHHHQDLIDEDQDDIFDDLADDFDDDEINDAYDMVGFEIGGGPFFI